MTFTAHPSPPPLSHPDKALVLSASISLSLTSPPPLGIHSIMSLKYAMACRYAACLAGSRAPPGQTEGAGGGAY